MSLGEEFFFQKLGVIVAKIDKTWRKNEKNVKKFSLYTDWSTQSIVILKNIHLFLHCEHNRQDS